MSEHTPGPWACEGPDMFGDYNIIAQGVTLAVGAVVSNLRQPAEVAANARIAAAAPDLYEVAKGYEAWEADLIENADWRAPTPKLTQAQFDRLLELQAMRNAALSKLSQQQGSDATGSPQATVEKDKS